MNHTIFTVVGARPQFVKAAIVSKALKKHKKLNEVLVHTGQHYSDNMSDIFFRELQLSVPDYNLGVGSGHHGAQTGQMLMEIEKLLINNKPSLVLVYGDTNSTLAAALAAAKLHIPIAHVEAGLRSFNRNMPEEINRIMTDHVSSLLFCPTDESVNNAEKEGFNEEKIRLVGDVMYDAAIFYGALAQQQSVILNTLTLMPKEFVLLTIHRAENTDDPVVLRALFTALLTAAKKHHIVLPLHPRTRAALACIDMLKEVEKNLQTIEPVGFLDMIMLEKNAALIVTDSGGVQKEAYFHRVPCITVRDQTEWVELVESDWNVLVPTADIDTLPLVMEARIGHNGQPVSLYGEGLSSERIAEVLADYL